MTEGQEDARIEPATAQTEIVSRRVDGPLSGQPPPVFLHSSFRTGSTWLWQKLRAAPTTIAYYEFFHEVLATLTLQQAKTIIFSTWDSRHPPAAPYFLEYLPLIEPEGGIAGFDRSISFGHFIPPSGGDGELEPREKIYLQHLVSAAWSRMRIPVLACTRSLGRARALRRSFGGKAIFLHRNLFHQWTSYCWQAETQNSYFLDTVRYTIEGSAHDPFLRRVSDWFGPLDSKLPQEAWFEIFILLHLYLYAIAYDATDLSVDLEGIANDKYARAHVEHEISEMVRHEIDLSDVRLQPCEFTGLAIACPRTMRDTIEQFAKLIPTASMSPDAMMFVGAAKDRALAAWERFEFFNKRTRVVLTGKAETAETRAHEQAARADVLQAERFQQLETMQTLQERQSASEAARADLAATVARLSSELEAASAERDALRERLSASATARADLDATVAGLSSELEAASAERDALRERLSASATARADLDATVAGLSSDLEAASAERDALRERLSASATARADLAATVAGLSSELEAASAACADLAATVAGLSSELEAASAARADLAATVAGLSSDLEAASAERDALRERLSASATARADLAATVAKLSSELEAASAARADLAATVARLSSEREAASVERDEARAAAGHARASAVDVSAQRDVLRECLTAAEVARDKLEASLVEARSRPEAPLSRLARKLLGGG